MRCVVLSTLVLLLVTASSGCHPLNRRASQSDGPYACASGCQTDAPYASSDECVDCQTDGQYACTDGSCGQGGRSHGLMQAIGRAFHRHHAPPQAPVGGPPVGTVTYPYYTVRGPRDFLVNDPPSIGPY